MRAMARGSTKRGNLVDVVILLIVLIAVAAVVLIVTLNWGRWDPDRETWDGVDIQKQPMDQRPADTE